MIYRRIYRHTDTQTYRDGERCGRSRRVRNVGGRTRDERAAKCSDVDGEGGGGVGKLGTAVLREQRSGLAARRSKEGVTVGAGREASADGA